MSIQETEQEIVEEFEIFPDWMEKYEHIIEIGNAVPKINEKYKDEAHEIKGCQESMVAFRIEKWKYFLYSRQRCNHYQRLGRILIRVFSGHTPTRL